MYRQFLGAIAALAVAGGAWAADLPVDKIAGFEKGQTTKSQVLASLGPAADWSAEPDGRSALIYNFTAPPDPPSAPDPQDVTIVFVFDQRNVLLGAQVYGKGPPPPGATLQPKP